MLLPIYNVIFKRVDYGTLKEDLPTVGSNPSLYSPHGSDENMRSDRAREDLYQWMAKQEPIKVVSSYVSCVFAIICKGLE